MGHILSPSRNIADRNTNNFSSDQPYPSPIYAWYVVFVLMLAYVFAFLDRQILALLVQPIKQDLAISDTEMSLVLGLAFAIFYTLLGIPIGRLTDRRRRRTIIGVGITIWCVMTAACGFARNFGQLFLARVGVGVGEATLQPCAMSLLSDYFPRELRGRAISVYSMGLGVGAGLALILGGQIIAYVREVPVINVAIVGNMFSWQLVFLVIGLPGLLVAALMFTVREPQRRDKMHIIGSVDDKISMAEVMSFLLKRWRTYGTHFLGLSIMAIIGNAYLAWIPTVFIRTWGWNISEISLWYGLVVSLGGVVGVISGGWLGDNLYNRGVKDGHMRAVLIGTIVLVPAAVLVPLLPSPWLGLLLLIPHSIGSGIATACGPAALMMVTPNQLRGQVAAVYWFVISILGLTIGPTAVALITDFAFGDEGALRYALALVSAATGSFVWLLFVNLKYYRASITEAEAERWTVVKTAEA